VPEDPESVVPFVIPIPPNAREVRLLSGFDGAVSVTWQNGITVLTFSVYDPTSGALTGMIEAVNPDAATNSRFTVPVNARFMTLVLNGSVFNELAEPPIVEWILAPSNTFSYKNGE
jgi:hypothetical protein